MKKTENGYILVNVLESEIDREKLTGKYLDGYRAKVAVETEQYKKNEEIFILKSGLILIDNKSLLYAVHEGRIVGRF